MISKEKRLCKNWRINIKSWIWKKKSFKWFRLKDIITREISYLQEQYTTRISITSYPMISLRVFIVQTLRIILFLINIILHWKTNQIVPISFQTSITQTAICSLMTLRQLLIELLTIITLTKCKNSLTLKDKGNLLKMNHINSKLHLQSSNSIIISQKLLNKHS